jgi:hypothetical protein
MTRYSFDITGLQLGEKRAKEQGRHVEWRPQDIAQSL